MPGAGNRYEPAQLARDTESLDLANKTASLLPIDIGRCNPHIAAAKKGSAQDKQVTAGGNIMLNPNFPKWVHRVSGLGTHNMWKRATGEQSV